MSSESSFNFMENDEQSERTVCELLLKTISENREQMVSED